MVLFHPQTRRHNIMIKLCISVTEDCYYHITDRYIDTCMEIEAGGLIIWLILTWTFLQGASLILDIFTETLGRGNSLQSYSVNTLTSPSGPASLTTH